MARLLMKNASHIVTCDPSDTVYTDSNLLMEDGVITYIGPEEQQAEEVIDAAGCIVYPGLINTHHHLYQTFSRNLPQVQNLELFDWLKALYEIWKNLDSRVIYHSSVTGMGELMKNGCTTCFDHHYAIRQVAGYRVGLFALEGRAGSGHQDVCLPWQHGPEQEGRWLAAGQRCADRGRDPAGLSACSGDLP